MAAASSPSSPQHTASSLPSLSSLLQYIALAFLGYILAGAPFLDTIYPSASTSTPRPPSSLASISPEKLSTLSIPSPDLQCPTHAYKGVHILSRAPLVVYIEDFLSEEEREEVVSLSEPHFTPSTVWTTDTERLDPSVRLSEKAPLPHSSATIQCIEERARAFQGWRPFQFIEKLWAQRYGTRGHYTYHYDWSTANRWAGRVSSFMVYVESNCTGGGTHFPRLEKPAGEGWCQFIECEGNEEEKEQEEESGVVDIEGGESRRRERRRDGVTFKPKAGNAVFWENMRSDGTGYDESWHAGLPVTSGSKIGLNIWTWYQEGYVPPVEMKEEGN